jgi:hypothetical protein
MLQRHQLRAARRPHQSCQVCPTAGQPDDRVLVHGSGFTGATQVTFDGVPAAPFGTGNGYYDSYVVVLAPPHALGPVDVHVTTPNGTSQVSTPYDTFTYIPWPLFIPGADVPGPYNPVCAFPNT